MRRSLARSQPSALSTRPAVRSVRAAAAAREVLRHRLPDASLDLEVIRRNGDAAGAKPPLVFIHGSYHAAWCYDEKFLPFFADLGFDCYAVSLRAQGGSTKPPGAKVAGTLATHASDVASFTASLPRPPVIIAHSFGGLVAQSYALSHRAAGLVFLNSVPPSGNGPMVLRFLLRDPMLSFRITMTFVAQNFKTDLKACREAFFSKDLPESELLRYQALLAECSAVKMIDLRALSKETPLPPAPPGCAPALVIGGTQDTVVDAEAVAELATYYDTQPVMLPGLPHDSMLDVQWRQVAEKIAARTVSRSVRAMAASAPQFNIIVKGKAEEKKLLDCPFCHRALLVLEEKKVPYSMTFVDLGNKPQWLFEKNPKGTVPILEEGDVVTPDSDVITVMLEDRFPSPSLKNSEAAQLLMTGNKAWPAAREFAKAHGGDEEKAKEAALRAELQALDDFLAKHGPLFGGSTFSQADASLAPKLYHISVALPALKHFSIPAEMKALHSYLAEIKKRESFVRTDYGADAIVAGWNKFLAGSH